ncbi:sulfite exporter TauE/SafE family protein [Pseudactinotalea sp. Z1748]|uniref:sulfite exporter TauE/SafE family protein n=1 Tax=Pseudactinotalea sp. Z1748 TaxID=3413027 RepID=UPI003C7C479C
MTGLEFSVLGWIVLGVAALAVGIAKTSIGGLGALAVAGFALFIPARESTAAVLLVLIIGDLVAVALYRRSADWAMLRRLLPAVLPGIGAGALIMAFIDDRTMTLLIAACILVALAIQIVMRRRQAHVPAQAPYSEAAPTLGSTPNLGATLGTGFAAGFTTMVANAAGPVMALYLLAVRADKMRFVGTMAWYFLIVNVAKVPFSIGLGLMTTTTLWLTLALAPAVLAGTWMGRTFLRRLPQHRFETLTLGASLLAGVVLLARGLI